MTNMPSGFDIRFADQRDVAAILVLVRQLAEYEKLAHQVVATEADLRQTLFGEHPRAEVLLGNFEGEPVGMALFFHNYSTFLGKAGIYLEDLFIQQAYRGRGFGKAMLRRLAQIAVERDCGRLEWAVLDWNEPAIRFYKSLSAEPMDEWTVYRLTGDALARLAE